MAIRTGCGRDGRNHSKEGHDQKRDALIHGNISLKPHGVRFHADTLIGSTFREGEVLEGSSSFGEMATVPRSRGKIKAPKKGGAPTSPDFGDLRDTPGWVAEKRRNPPANRWWARSDLNRGPNDYESSALTAELRAHPKETAFHQILGSGRRWASLFRNVRTWRCRGNLHSLRRVARILVYPRFEWIQL